MCKTFKGERIKIEKMIVGTVLQHKIIYMHICVCTYMFIYIYMFYFKKNF